MSSCDDEVADMCDMDGGSSPPVLQLSMMLENCMSPNLFERHVNTGSSLQLVDQTRTPDGLNTPSFHLRTPLRVALWDSGFGSPITPVASSTMAPGPVRRPTFRGSGLLPIPFAYDEREECLQKESSSPTDADRLAISDKKYSLTTPPGAGDKSGTVTTPLGRSLRSLNISQTPRSLIHHRAARKSVDKASRFKLLATRERRAASCRRQSGLTRPSADPNGPQVNANPFVLAASRLYFTKSEKSSAINNLYDSLNRTGNSDKSFIDVDERPRINQQCLKLSLRQINTSRFDEEFFVLNTIGDGQFGIVYKCINRIDGCLYAVKKSKFPVAGSAYERNALNEVYAHAVLGKHRHIVGYYSAWAEDDHVFVQMEYCNGGSLSSLLSECQNKHLTEPELKQLTVHVAAGLKYIHSLGLVHLDIKPDNIFIDRLHTCANVSMNDGSMDEGLGEDSVEELDAVVYKIGDLGQVTSSSSPTVDEGDCRYLPAELLADRFDDLPMADIFSLALTVFEAASGTDLPPNGPLWHEYRNDGLPYLSSLSPEFNALLKLMASFDPKLRPPAQEIVQHAALNPFAQKSTCQLRRELCDERVKNETLTRELEETRRALLELQQNSLTSGQALVNNRSQRLVGRSCGRSRSLITF